MTYRWTVALRDALMYAEANELMGQYTDDDPELIKTLGTSMTALASIPLGTTLEPTDAELEVALARDGDCPVGPTWEWIEQLVSFYYGGGYSPTVVQLQEDPA